MKPIYLDWNIFNKLERVSTLSPDEQPAYQQLEKLILDGEISIPHFQRPYQRPVSWVYQGQVLYPRPPGEHLPPDERSMPHPILGRKGRPLAPPRACRLPGSNY